MVTNSAHCTATRVVILVGPIPVTLLVPLLLIPTNRSTHYCMAIATLGSTTRIQHFFNPQKRMPPQSSSVSKTMTTTTMMEENLKVLYINLMVTDPSQAVQRAVQKRIAERDLPKPLHKVANKVGQRVAKRVATPEFVANIMSEKLPLELTKKLKKRGITGVADTVFVEAPYIVIQLQVQHVETHRLVESKTEDFHDDETGELESRATLSPSVASYITKCLDCLWRLLGSSRSRRVKSAIEDYHLPRLVQTKMQAFIPEFLEEKLHRKGMEIDSEVLSEEKQSRFFYTQLHAFRAAKKKDNSSQNPHSTILGFVRNKNEGEKKKNK